MDAKNIIISLLIGYFLGTISGGYLIGKIIYKDDIRNHGSGNTGATNVQRTYGNISAIVTLAIDLFKGFFAVIIARKLFGNEYGLVAGLGAVLGHNFPYYLGFRGGKGIATSAGVVLGISMKFFICLVLLFAAIVLSTGYVSLGSIVVAICAPFIANFLGVANTTMEKVFILILVFLIIIRHKDNIKRLIKGNENKLPLFRKKEKK